MPAPMAVLKGAQVAQAVTQSKAGRTALPALVFVLLIMPVVMVFALLNVASSSLAIGFGGANAGCTELDSNGIPTNYTFTLPRADPNPAKRLQTKNPNVTPGPLPETYDNRGHTVPYAAYFKTAEQRYQVPWYLLAAISWDEMRHGSNPGTWKINYAGAYGPMQFLSETWKRAGVDGDDDGRISWDSVGDQIHSAANLLVMSGFKEGAAGVVRALRAYNDVEWYVNDILFYAEKYAGGGAITVNNTLCGALDSGKLAAVVAFVISKVHFPYILGAEGPFAYDCSGLVWAAYHSVGVNLNRTASDQADDPKIDIVGRKPLNVASLIQGDLLFYDNGPHKPEHFSKRLGLFIEHVAVYIGNGEIVNASSPSTGVVRRKLSDYDFDKVVAVGRVKGIVQDTSSSGPWTRPVTGVVTSEYGSRIHPITGKQSFHHGLDIGGNPCGTPIHAVADGVVTFAGPAKGYGFYIEINHGGMLNTGYGHEEAQYVKAGDVVRRGQPIAAVGDKGDSTACHLHFEVLMAEKGTRMTGQVDPHPVLLQHGVDYWGGT